MGDNKGMQNAAAAHQEFHHVDQTKVKPEPAKSKQVRPRVRSTSPRSATPAKNTQAETATNASFAALESSLGYLKPEDIELIRSAYRFADTAHLGQMRRNGDPYITHPIAVALLCTTWQLDAPALMAALLHDVMEDCGVQKNELVERFGATVANLVDGLTKLDKLQFTTRAESQAENFRKMLLAMAQDVRVILIKIADRTHNMRTLADVPREKWARIAQETLDIYVPIAHRLGLHQIYRELQDLVFQFLHPWRYQTLKKAVATARGRRKDLISSFSEQVTQAFAQARISMDIVGREKTLFSIYRKMKSKDRDFSKVNDIYGFRIIVPSVSDCYTALGIIHQMYRPVPGRFKDYIAIPKVNAYQSLHTTVVGPAGLQIEFQFRTDTMNTVADSGVAAHWQYKLDGSLQSTQVGTAWLQSLLDIQNETRDAAEFWEHVKVDLFPDEVYVFTHTAEIMAMPRGATLVDFAYAIHTNVGDRMIGATVNGEQMPLRTELRNGDTIEIVTGAVAQPNPAWLSFVTTGRARSKIRHYLKTQELGESENLGEKLLRQAIRAEGVDEIPKFINQTRLWEKLLRFTGNKSKAELMVDIGLGRRVASIVAKQVVNVLAKSGVKPDALLLSQERFMSHDNISQGSVTIDGSESKNTVNYASCCLPIPGDEIIGYMGHGEGLRVHRSDCAVVVRGKNKDAERFIQVEWSDEMQRNFPTRIQVVVQSRKGGLAKIANVIAHSEADIVQVAMDGEHQFDETSEMEFQVTVRDHEHLQDLLRNLERESIVIEAKRIVAG